MKGGIDGQGHYKCFFCDGIVVEDGTDMAIDVYPDWEDDQALLHYMRCNKCGAEYEVIQPSEPTKETPMGSELRLRKQILSDD